MSAPNDGGPAFACAAENGHQEGMSLRDWFAGQALVGDYAHLGSCRDKSHAEKAAARYYMIADAMLAERAKVRP